MRDIDPPVRDMECDECGGSGQIADACVWCGADLDDDEIHASPDGSCCESCFDDRWVYCAECCEAVDYGDTTEVDGDPVCDDCTGE